MQTCCSRELGCGAVAVYHAQIDRDYERVQAEGSAFPARAPIDDPAFVRLRTYLRDVDLADVDSVLGNAGIAFPFAVQGRLTGALVCASRANEEGFDPDERAAVRALAARVAASLEALRSGEYALLVKAIADGAIDPEEARTRARALDAGT